MSLYCSVQTKFKDQEALIKALLECKNANGRFFTLQDIEIHEVPQNMIGYQGDKRKEKANIIIRRQNVGSASNDIGFVRNENGEFVAIISEYDRSYYSESWVGQLKQNYCYYVIKNRQGKKGRTIKREKLNNGNQRIIIQDIR